MTLTTLMTPDRCTRASAGFTLIELMIAVAVAAILAAVALPSYREHVATSRRVDARTALMSVAQLMERAYGERGTYAQVTLGTNGVYPSRSPQGYYTLTIESKSASGYTLKATPTGAQASDRCGSFTLDQANTRGVSGGSLISAQCW
jgi:type IV pilus assembly protein PilE